VQILMQGEGTMSMDGYSNRSKRDGKPSLR